MFSKIFIERPILAMVISIMITLIGGIAILTLPIAQYPQIVPPQIAINTNYLGADALTVEQNVAQPIEQEVNGSENMLYITSNNASTGALTGTVTYEVGSNQDMALVDVNNRVNIAKPKLPQDVQRFGVTVKKKSSAILVILSLSSTNPLYDDVFLSNYATLNIVDALKRIPGVGDVMIFGARDYGMRIWLDPDKMARLGVTASDVINALNEQNKQAPAGQIGLPPTKGPQELQYSVNVKGRLQDTSEFSNIIVRAMNDGSFVRIRDVGRVALEAQDYTQVSRLNGGAAANIGVYQLPSANALDVVKKIEETMKEISTSLPDGVQYSIPYNTTIFVEKSIEEVLHTLFEAIVLVLIVVFVFLQNWRATLIPMLAVPVSLVGTFAMFILLGFSINLLTLFGLILAIGIVVDDAIVVVEAVSEKMEHGMDAKTASIEAMKEVGGPVIAIALILDAVFIPVAFMGGIAGQMYQQFALTLAGSVTLSAIVALTLTPALTSLMLKPPAPMGGPVGAFFAWFNRVFTRSTNAYVGGVRGLTRRLSIVVIAVIAIMAGAYGLFNVVPTGFIPDEDQGACFIYVQLPNAASLGRTDSVIKEAERIIRKDPTVKDMVSFIGNNIVSGVFGSNTGSIIVTFKPFEDRTTKEQSVFAAIGRLKRQLAAIPSAIVVPFNLPPIIGLGNAGGFQFELQDKTGGDPANLAKVAKEFIEKASKRPELAGLASSFRADVPQVDLAIDREKVKSLDVPLGDVFSTLQSFLGGYYVNDLTLFGKTFKVYIQAEADARSRPTDIDRYHVRTRDGDMVPLSTLTKATPTNGPSYTFRYNLYRSAEIAGAAAPGYSSGDAIRAMEESAKEFLPPGYGFEWTGTAFQEKKAGGQTVFIFGMAIVAVFLLLAALYESWKIPFAVILAVPIAVFGAMFGQFVRGLENNIYAQIGLVMLIGLAAKNAILIVEYANIKKNDEGMSTLDAAITASRLRFRPILMTSFAFILGVVPLVIATGAGAASRNALGTAVFAGMLIATMLGVFTVPSLYVLIARKKGEPASKDDTPDKTEAAGSSPSPQTLTIIAAVIGGSMMWGCSMAPTYERPDVRTPTVYRGDASTPDSLTVASVRWFDLFNDKQLRTLIDTALVRNNDLLIAAARVDQTRAQLGLRTADRLPQLYAGVGASRQQYPEAVSAVLPARTLNTFTGTMDVSYEADLWGKYASAQEAARRQLLASEANRRAVITSVVAGVATAYLELVELHWELDISKRTATSRLGSLNLIKSRKEFGIANDLEVRQAEEQLYQATTVIPDIERAIMVKENEINVLMGHNPGAIMVGDSLGAQLRSPQLPTGLPSTLLERRPDIIAAEESLISSNANIGVTRAAFFPSVSLTAGTGFFGRDISNMFTPAGFIWSIGANALQPLFQGGRLTSNLDLSYAQRSEAVALYQKTVITAFQEVSNSIVNYRKYGESRVEQEKLVRALRDELRLANLRYEGGYTGYLQVLDSQRSLFNAELQYARVRLAELRSAVLLYKALGGGWQ